MKFRKKPVEIDAWLWSGQGTRLWPDWMLIETHVVASGEKLMIQTLEGWMTASMGDWIIRGVKGEIYPCKPDIFDMTYEAA